MRFYPLLFFLLIIALGFQCTYGPTGSTVFELKSAKETNVEFSNILYESSDLNIFTYEYFFNGAGLGVGDINNDGLPDLFFSGNMVSGKLYLNKGNFEFQDITTQAGISTKDKWGTGVSMVDINSDGWLDIYLCYSGPYGEDRRRNQLYINNRDNTFTEMAKEYGLDDPGYQTTAAFFDFDRDGDLDVYLLNNTTNDIGPNVIRPKLVNGEMPNTDKLLRNDNGHFIDISRGAGVLKEGYGLGVSIADIDGDGWEDIYVSNDYVSNDLLYVNNGDGTFTDKASDILKHTSYSSMGCDISDFNNDGLVDIAAVDMLPPDNIRRKLMIGSMNYNRYLSELRSGYDPQSMRNTLQLNQGLMETGEPIYSEVGQLAGIHSTDWSWSPLFLDADNDGLRDLLITNGYPRDNINLDFIKYKANVILQSSFDAFSPSELNEYMSELQGVYLPNYVYQNTGNYRFKDQSYDWGFRDSSFSHAAAFADLDNDGDLDYITNNSYDPAFIYQNNSNEIFGNHFIRIGLIGNEGNTMGIGAKVAVHYDSSFQYQQFSPYRGFQSSVEPVLHFGLGNVTIIDSITVIWPDRSKSTIFSPQSDRVITVDQKNASEVRKGNMRTKSQTIFEKRLKWSSTSHEHKDPHFSDFNQMPLIPHKYSTAGPNISVGDVNGDELDDFFMGGAFRQSGKIFIQRANGSFELNDLDIQSADCEDLGSVFLDFDGDGDLDLYVTSGSSEFENGSHYYEDRLYVNDGKGNFAKAMNVIPDIRTSTSSVTAIDFDRDGDEDLLVAGHIDFEDYPKNPRSYLLENNGNGKFIDVTNEKGPELKKFGMIKQVITTDVNDDGWEDIVIAAEWKPLSIFINSSGTFSNQTDNFGLGNTTGWWNTVISADLDNDGDEDLIAGNLGLNSSFGTSKKPLSRYVDDYDSNGRLDPVMVWSMDNETVPLHYRDDILNWINPLKKRFNSYQSYAESNWQNLFPDHKPLKDEIDFFESCWFENKDNEHFVIHKLPTEAQFAPISAILPIHADKDNVIDLLVAGNSYGSDPQIGRYDALNGLLLKGSGNKEFRPIGFRESGFFVPGESRDLKLVSGYQGQKKVLVGMNNDSLQVFDFTD